MDGSVTSTGWGGEDKSGLVNEIVAPGRCKAKGNAMQCNASAREKARGRGSRCATCPAPVKIFTEIIGNWRKVEIFNRIEEIPPLSSREAGAGSLSGRKLKIMATCDWSKF